MVVPFLLLLVSLAGVAAGLIRPEWPALLLVCGSAAIASLILLLRAARRSARQGPVVPQDAAPRKNWHADPSERIGPPWIVVDGSNVMYWRDGTVQVATVREVLGALAARGFVAGAVFDANAGYLLAGRYLDHGALGRLVGLPEDRVMVVNKGEVADRIVLQAARDLGARIVSNDRYRDWADDFPEVAEPGLLVRGGYRAGELWLDLEAGSVRARRADL